MLVFMVQFAEARVHTGSVNLLEPLVLLVFGVGAGLITVPALGLLVSRSRGAKRSWLGKRRRRRAAANAEVRARAQMSELCPDGWQARITLLHSDDEQPRTPSGERARVALDWTELQGPGHSPAVMRRVWAETIGEALDAMVDDRRTDEALEQIERGAVADGARWPDL
jgi:hypothetical protein